jgi:flagellar biogenesis protein FliO
MDLLQQGFALLAVFGLLGTALWFLKGRKSLNLRGARRMQIVERIALTPQHTLCLVKVGDRLMMIGTAPSNCQLIESIEDASK